MFSGAECLQPAHISRIGTQLNSDSLSTQNFFISRPRSLLARRLGPHNATCVRIDCSYSARRIGYMVSMLRACGSRTADVCRAAIASKQSGFLRDSIDSSWFKLDLCGTKSSSARNKIQIGYE